MENHAVLLRSFLPSLSQPFMQLCFHSIRGHEIFWEKGVVHVMLLELSHNADPTSITPISFLILVKFHLNFEFFIFSYLDLASYILQ